MHSQKLFFFHGIPSKINFNNHIDKLRYSTQSIKTLGYQNNHKIAQFSSFGFIVKHIKALDIRLMEVRSAFFSNLKLSNTLN